MFSKKDFLASLRLMALAGFFALGALQSQSLGAWTAITIPGRTQITNVAVADSILFASADTGVFRSTNNGTTWQKVTGLNSFYELKGNNVNLFALAYGQPYVFYVSVDHGISWNKLNTTDSLLYGSAIEFSVQNNTTLFISNYRSYLSENNNQSCEILNTVELVANPMFKCGHIMGNILFISGQGGIVSSHDLGHSWSDANYGIDNTAHINKITSINKYLYCGLSFPDRQTGIYCSIDSGNSWKSMGLRQYVNDISFSKTTVFVGAGNSIDSGGIFASPLDSSNWTDISTSPRRTAISLACDTGYLYAITEPWDAYNGNTHDSLFRRPLSEVNSLLKMAVTGPQSMASNNFVVEHFPSQHALGITFSPGRTEKASLRVYSATGKTITTLFDGMTQSGGNDFFWDYRNVPSGIYCIGLNSESGKAVKKVQVMR